MFVSCNHIFALVGLVPSQADEPNSVPFRSCHASEYSLLLRGRTTSLNRYVLQHTDLPRRMSPPCGVRVACIRRVNQYTPIVCTTYQGFRLEVLFLLFSSIWEAGSRI